jgi:hypothetical protein
VNLAGDTCFPLANATSLARRACRLRHGRRCLG